MHRATISSPLDNTLKNCDARKIYSIDTRKKFRPQENVIEEQLNNNELKHGAGNY